MTGQQVTSFNYSYTMENYYPPSGFSDDSYLIDNCTNCYNLDQNHQFFNQGAQELSVLIVENPEDFKYPWRSNQHFYPNILTFVVTLLIGLFGNIVVITVLAGDRKSHTTTNVFLVSLTVADLLMLSVCVPLETTRLFVVLLNIGGLTCRMGHYFMMLSFTASVLNLTAVSLERFIVIVFPMKSRSLCTMNNCRKSVLLVWVMSSVLACPVISVVEEESIIYSNPNRTTQVTAHYCKDVDSLVFPTYRLLVLFCIPALLMIIFYTAVIRELWKSAKNIRAMTSSSQSSRIMEYPQKAVSHRSKSGQESYYLTVQSSAGGRMSTSISNGRIPLNASEPLRRPSPSPIHVNFKGKGKSLWSSPITKKKTRDKGEDVRRTRKQVIKMLIVVVMLFILCWGPSIICDMLIGLGKQTFTQEFYVFKWVSSLLPFIHCCINPLIYCFMSKNIRTSMSRVIWGPCRRCTGKCFGNSSDSNQKSYFTRAAASRMSSSFAHDVTTANTDFEISAI